MTQARFFRASIPNLALRTPLVDEVSVGIVCFDVMGKILNSDDIDRTVEALRVIAVR